PLVPLGRRALTARRRRHQKQHWGWLAIPMTARRRDLDPAVHPLLALLHGREVDRRAGLKIGRDHRREDEFIIVGFGQVAAGPRNLLHTFIDLDAVADVVALAVFAGDHFKLPARLWHGFHGDHAIRDADADRRGGRSLATVSDAHDRLVTR